MIKRAFSGCLFAVLFMVPSSVLAQDTTPPALLDFAISPTAIDLSQGEVVYEAGALCGTVVDDLSGVNRITVS